MKELRVKELLKNLDFEGCIKLLEKLNDTLAIDDLIFERMIELDEERFIKFSLEY